jgi:hypothetical protein
MAETRLMRPIFLAGLPIALLTFAACDEAPRSARASTAVAEAEIKTRLPESEVSDEFLLATATAAAEAASVPHPVAVGVVAPPPEPPPAVAPDNAMSNAAAPPATTESKANGNGM